MDKKNKWYDHKWAVSLLLIFFYPLGLFGFIKTSKKPVVTMILTTLLYSGFWTLIFSTPSSTTENKVTSAIETTEPNYSDSIQTDDIWVGGQSYRVEEERNGNLALQPVPSLDGVWGSDPSGGGTFTINGSTGVITTFSSSKAWLDAERKGYVKVGDQNFRNLTSSGNFKWTGQILMFDYNTDTPTVAEGVSWINSTITLSADGQSFQVSNSYGTATYTRRQ